jgi:hypothetical protein
MEKRIKIWDDIYSPLQGKVQYALQDTKSAYGRRLYIEYDKCILMFAHLNELYVKEGDIVEPFMLLAQMGSTGYSPSKHLHVSAFSKRAKELTALYTMDPTYILKLAPAYVTNTKVSNGYNSRFCNPKLEKHEGIDFSGNKDNLITGWDSKDIDPLSQNYRTKRTHPEEYDL